MRFLYEKYYEKWPYLPMHFQYENIIKLFTYVKLEKCTCIIQKYKEYCMKTEKRVLNLMGRCKYKILQHDRNKLR